MTSGEANAAEPFDVVVLGSGEAGKYLSWKLGAQGKRVAMVERRYIGGSWPNIACLPSKNVVHSAKVAWYAQNLPRYGMQAPSPGVDMTVVRERKRDMVSGLVEMHNARFAASKVEFLCGEGTFVGPRTLSVRLRDGGSRLLAADVVIVSTGSRATVPEIPGLQDAAPLTHVEELELDTLPQHLLVLGGGYVGLEFAQAMRRFGSEVTVVDHNQRLLPREDEDVSAELSRLLVSEGIRFVLGATVESVTGRSGDAVTMHVRSAAGDEVLQGTHILALRGARPTRTASAWTQPVWNSTRQVTSRSTPPAHHGRKRLRRRRLCRQPALHAHRL